MRGFFFVVVAMLLFIASAAGLSLLASYTIDASTRQADTTGRQAAVYRAIVGDVSVDGDFGYLGDIGDYPADLADLLVEPAGNPAGWNGPYLHEIPISDGMLQDAYGSPLQYFNQLTPGVLDQLAVISSGPDHGSTNTAANPNVASQFTGIAPGNPSYAADNPGNIAFPDFNANAAALNYQNAGTLTYNILNFNRDARAN